MSNAIRTIVLGLFLHMTATTVAADMTEREIEAPGPNGPLRGTLLTAGNERQPVVLIVPGSGPTDRDGNNPLGVRASTYRLLAEGLAANGVSSLRIDKRGMFGSAGAVPDANAVTIGDYADDVRTWIRALRAQTGARCVWLLGHSEGGLVALAAAKDSTGICGLILAAAPGRTLGDIMRTQFQRSVSDPSTLAQALDAIDRLEAGNHVDLAKLHPGLRPLFRSELQDFMIDLFSYDPAALLKTASLPALILQGQHDVQIGEADARTLLAANPAARLQLFPDANHVFKSTPFDDAMSQRGSYSDPDQPLTDGVIAAIVQFMRNRQDAP